MGPGTEAPAYRAQLLDGGDVALSSLRGKAVLLNLWATWCEPCRHELADLAALHERFAADGVIVVAVSLDADRDTLTGYLERRKLPFTLWHDPRDRASATFGVDTLPATFVIGRDGVVVWSKSGAVTAREGGLVEAIEHARRTEKGQ